MVWQGSERAHNFCDHGPDSVSRTARFKPDFDFSMIEKTLKMKTISPVQDTGFAGRACRRKNSCPPPHVRSQRSAAMGTEDSSGKIRVMAYGVRPGTDREFGT